MRNTKQSNFIRCTWYFFPGPPPSISVGSVALGRQTQGASAPVRVMEKVPTAVVELARAATFRLRRRRVLDLHGHRE